MKKLRPFALAVCLGTLAVPLEARAGDPVSPSSEPLGKDEAIKAFTKGRDLILAGKQAEALPVLMRSFQLLPSPNTELLIAHAEKGLGHAARAAGHYEHVVVSAQAEIAKGNTKYEETVAEAKRALGELLPGLGSVEITAPASMRVSVTRGREDVVSFTGSSRVLAEPGRVKVKAGDEAERDVDVSAGQTAKLDLTAVLAPAKAPTPVEPAPAEPPAKSGLGALGIAGIVVGGVGLVGVGVFAGMGSSAKSKYDELVACGCSLAEAAQLREDGKQAQVIANVSLGVGVGLAAGGLTMLIVDVVSPKKKSDEAAAISRFAPVAAMDAHGGFAGVSLALP